MIFAEVAVLIGGNNNKHILSVRPSEFQGLARPV